MDVAILLRYAHHNAQHIFVRCLFIDTRKRSIFRHSLHKVAGFILITDGDGHYLQLVEIRLKVARACHREHLQQTLVSAVVAVLGTTVALGNPHRTVLLEKHVVYIVRKEHRVIVELASRTVADNSEHLVQAEQVDDEVVLHQVVAETYLRSFETVAYQCHIQQTGIQCDVAMVRHKEICLAAVQVFQSTISERFGAALHNLVYQRTHHHILQLIAGGYAFH